MDGGTQPGAGRRGRRVGAGLPGLARHAVPARVDGEPARACVEWPGTRENVTVAGDTPAPGTGDIPAAVGAASELVTVLAEDGRPVGVAPRAEVRRRRLLHAATAVAVRRGDGRIYVHRRTPTKDIYPGAYDCWAGGVLTHGERPEIGAVRELAEELGIRGAVLRPLTVVRWADDRAQAVYHVFETTWDGPIIHQPEEVAWGDWWTLPMLAEQLARPDFPFVPDGRYLLEVTGLLPPLG